MVNKADRSKKIRNLLIAGFASLIVAAMLCSLGFWQLERLKWKEELISRIETRLKFSPLDLPDEAAWPALIADDYDYHPVIVRGEFLHEKEALVYRATADGQATGNGPGVLVMTPFRLGNGALVIVNRGFVPLDNKDPSKRLQGQTKGQVTLTGLMRPPEPRNAFTPADTPQKGLWFTRDPAAIAVFFKLDRVAPFTIDASLQPTPGGGPQGGATVLAIRNDHLAYAWTWFGLAITLGIFYVIHCLFSLRGDRSAKPGGTT